MYVYIHIYTVCINVENLKIYILNTYTFQSCNVFENGYIYIYIYIYIYRIDGEEINNSLYLAQKYVRIFVRGYYLVQDTNSFPRAKQKRLGKYSPLLSTLKLIIVLVNTTQKTKKKVFFFSLFGN